jgi:signal peptidase I
LVTATVVAFVFRAGVVQPFSVPSAAMMPTFQTGDRIVVVKSRSIAGPIHSGDIVVFRRPSYFPCHATRSGNGDLVQRVIAVPGETIWSSGKKIFVNGHPLSERGWYDTKYGQVGATPIRRTTVPADRYFVMGDNRSDACDSRAFGTITGSSVVGKVFAIVARAGRPYIRLF